MAGDADDLPPHLKPQLDSSRSGRTRKALAKAMGGSLEKLSTGRLGRATQLGKLALAGGRAMVADRARSALGSKDEAGVGIATEMLKTFSQMRGVTMKLGQMLSYLDDALPPEARRVLSVLQRDVNPMPWSVMSQVFEENIGRKAEDVFQDLDETPIAAASIGQVHRAVLPDGTAVAVKIQYPGMSEAMRADLENVKVLNLVQRMMSFSTDTKAIMSELEQRFLDECDFRKEAAYQTAYRNRFTGHPVIVVPEVHEDLSAEQVLVTTFHEGRGYYEWLHGNPDDAERQRVAHTFYRFYLGSFYMDGLFNCDPHPGNYLFTDDGHVVFLDYGCCRRFDPERLDMWIALCKAVYSDERDEIGRLATRLGFVKGPGTYDPEAFRDLMRYLYTPYLSDEVFDFAQFRPQETFRKMFTNNANLFKLDMPHDAVFLNRINFGLVSLLGEMGGRLNVRALVDAYFEGMDPDWPEDPARGRRFAA